MPMTYNSLSDQIISYCKRNDLDFINEVPNFIYQAQQRICRESKSLGLEIYVNSTFLPGNAVYSKPAGWRRNLSFSFGSGALFNVRKQLFLRSYEFCRNYTPDPNVTGEPQFYCDYGFTSFLVAPTPNLAYPFELGYLQLPDPITPINQTNYLTDYAPDVLLYACLLEAIPFLKNDERIPVWQSMYDRGLASLNNQDDQRILDRASNRSSD